MALIMNQFTNTDELNKVFAQAIVELLNEAIVMKGKASLAVSGGSTPKPLFLALSNADVEWEKVSVTLVDDRWLDSKHADSNENLVRTNLLQNKAAKAEFISLLTKDQNASDAELEISRRLDKLDAQIDVLILGMGEDGHTASLFPCSAQIKEGLNLSRDMSAIATQPTTAPYQRMSMSLAKIVAAKHVFLHLTGEKKKAVLEDAMANYTELEKPITAVCKHTNVELMWAP